MKNIKRNTSNDFKKVESENSCETLLRTENRFWLSYWKFSGESRVKIGVRTIDNEDFLLWNFTQKKAGSTMMNVTYSSVKNITHLKKDLHSFMQKWSVLTFYTVQELLDLQKKDADYVAILFNDLKEIHAKHTY